MAEGSGLWQRTLGYLGQLLNPERAGESDSTNTTETTSARGELSVAQRNNHQKQRLAEQRMGETEREHLHTLWGKLTEASESRMAAERYEERRREEWWLYLHAMIDKYVEEE